MENLARRPGAETQSRYMARFGESVRANVYFKTYGNVYLYVHTVHIIDEIFFVYLYNNTINIKTFILLYKQTTVHLKVPTNCIHYLRLNLKKKNTFEGRYCPTTANWGVESESMYNFELYGRPFSFFHFKGTTS